jgi:hypothetical protein
VSTPSCRPERAHVVTVLYEHGRAGALGHFLPLGQACHARPWAETSPATVLVFFFFFPISFWFKNSRNWYKLLKCIENGIKLGKMQNKFL